MSDGTEEKDLGKTMSDAERVKEAIEIGRRYGHTDGAPKTMENTIERLWTDSSMAEWATKCAHCNKWNIATIEADALNMIGKHTVVCAKCGKPLDPGDGCWVHTNQPKGANHENTQEPDYSVGTRRLCNDQLQTVHSWWSIACGG